MRHIPCSRTIPQPGYTICVFCSGLIVRYFFVPLTNRPRAVGAAKIDLEPSGPAMSTRRSPSLDVAGR